MIPIIKDNIQETSTSTGLTEFILGGAVSGYATFSSFFSEGESFYYYAYHTTLNEWELGYATLANTNVVRMRVFYSSNSNNFVNFSAGTKNVFLTDNLEATSAVAWGNITGTLSAQTDLQTALNAKQATLVSGSNIRTVNGSTLLGSTNLLAGSAFGGIVSITQSASTTSYFVMNYILSGVAFAGRSGRQIPFSAGTFKNFRLRLNTGQPASGSLVVSLFNNAAVTAISITIPAGSASGVYSDNTNSVSVVNDDLLCYEVINNATGSSGTIQTISINYYAS